MGDRPERHHPLNLLCVLCVPFVVRGLREQIDVVRRHWPILSLLGVLGVTNFNTFVYLGLQTTTATNAVLLVSTTPVMIVAISFLLLLWDLGLGSRFTVDSVSLGAIGYVAVLPSVLAYIVWNRGVEELGANHRKP